MNQDIEVVGPPPEPTPAYVRWRQLAILSVTIFIISVHMLVWFSSWSDQRGNSFMEITGVWIGISAIASIGCTVAYADAREHYNLYHR